MITLNLENRKIGWNTNEDLLKYANQIAVIGSEGWYFKFKNRKIGWNTNEDLLKKYEKLIIFRKREHLNDTIEKLKGCRFYNLFKTPYSYSCLNFLFIIWFL